MIFLLNKDSIEVKKAEAQEETKFWNLFFNITHLDWWAWHLPVHYHERSLHAIRRNAMRPKAVCDIERAIVTRLAHCLIRLQLEGVIAVQRRRTILACSPTRVTLPVDDVGDLRIDRRQTKVIVRRYYRF